MKVFKITSDMIKTSNWAGGTTTELFIWPMDAEYQKRNFDIRLSTATIDIESSNFTKLPGIHRILMVLEGKISLLFNGDKNIMLKPWESAEFEGEWTTTSKGTGKDVNLMIANSWKANMEHIAIKESPVTIEQVEDMKIIYCTDGDAQMSFEKESKFLNRGSVLCIQKELVNEKIVLNVAARNQTNLIVCSFSKT